MLSCLAKDERLNLICAQPGDRIRKPGKILRKLGRQPLLDILSAELPIAGTKPLINLLRVSPREHRNTGALAPLSHRNQLAPQLPVVLVLRSVQQQKSPHCFER